MLSNILIALVAALHLYFMYLEMVGWNRPLGRRVFRTTPEFSAASKALAANQGLYNGFLVAGLVWGLWLGKVGFGVKTFFLACMIAAGVFGAATVGRRILYVQALSGSWRCSPCGSLDRWRRPDGGTAPKPEAVRPGWWSRCGSNG